MTESFKVSVDVDGSEYNITFDIGDATPISSVAAVAASCAAGLTKSLSNRIASAVVGKLLEADPNASSVLLKWLDDHSEHFTPTTTEGGDPQ